MIKIKLMGLGNHEEYSYYMLEKDQSFFNIFGKVFYDIFKVSADFDEEYDEKKGEFVRKKRNINEYKDKHEGFISVKEDSRIDIFYGDKVIFLTVYCPKQLRKKFNDELGKITYMPKVKLRKKK